MSKQEITSHLFYLDTAGRWDLARDTNQWMIRQIARPKDWSCTPHRLLDKRFVGENGSLVPPDNKKANGLWFVGAKKNILYRFIEKREIALTPEAKAQLEALPELFPDLPEVVIEQPILWGDKWPKDCFKKEQAEKYRLEGGPEWIEPLPAPSSTLPSHMKRPIERFRSAQGRHSSMAPLETMGNQPEFEPIPDFLNRRRQFQEAAE